MHTSPPPVTQTLLNADGEQLARALAADLEQRHGSLLGGVALQRALGFTSGSAFRQACHRGVLPVAVFTIPNRRGRYALTHEVARWLASLRQGAINND